MVHSIPYRRVFGASSANGSHEKSARKWSVTDCVRVYGSQLLWGALNAAVSSPVDPSERPRPPAEISTPRDAFEVAGRGDASGIQAALSRGLDPNLKKDLFGFTLLHVAAEAGHAEVCKALLAGGANPNVRNDLGQTPLHRAALQGRKDVVAVLLTHDAEPGVADNDGKRPCDLAELNGHSDLSRQLTPQAT